VLLVGLTGCATPTPPPAPAASATTHSADSPLALAAAIEADASQSDAESDGKRRAELAVDATRRANDCLARAPAAAACLYGSALALGLEARVHPTRAGALLKEMLGNLARAEDADAGFADAGPARVTAQVLLKAPAWPLGPGDADGAVAAARRAVALRPDYPPNELVLGQALEKTGDSTAAQEAYARAQALARALPASPEQKAWLKEANQGLVGRY
jgi:tetratricopeptide (TPR) repeat protein